MPSVLSLFSGAGGLDLGFELAGFDLVESVEIDEHCVETLRRNRPNWTIRHLDVKEYVPSRSLAPDVLLAGFPCQGFSLGGNRQSEDVRNQLYLEVVRVAAALRPRIVVMENVLNLRTMLVPGTRRTFVSAISESLQSIGYSVKHDVFRMSQYGVPQTRRRFLFIGFLGQAPAGYHFPPPEGNESIRPHLYDLAQGSSESLPNHTPTWGFKSHVHIETHESYDSNEEVVPVRFSRTASDGFPIRSFDAPFPAVDTATVWGWAQGNVVAKRVTKDRSSSKFIRNPEADVTLWRISASRLRTFTAREYARLQTFPDSWVLHGGNKRDIHLQIGNAVPVEFARRIADNVKEALAAMNDMRTFSTLNSTGAQSELFA